MNPPATTQSPAPPPVFAAIDLSKRYRRKAPWALHGVSLELPTGSITALIGPNGAGKSTLIRAAVGFERPTEGRVEVAGIDPWRHRPAALAQIGYVPQSMSLYRGLSVADHVRLAGALRRSFDAELAAARLEELGLAIDRRVGDLSGGEQAQVALALAIATRAPLLLLDEPIASLDPLARREFLAVLLNGARRDGSTVLLATHIVADVAGLADRIVVLGAGRKLLDDAVPEVLAAHRVVGPGEVEGAEVVSRFPTTAGDVHVLVRGGTVGVPATLEDVVLGYLSSSRARATELGRVA
jgi:ABC-2 type transport system ATP-binding protein